MELCAWCDGPNLQPIRVELGGELFVCSDDCRTALKTAALAVARKAAGKQPAP